MSNSNEKIVGGICYALGASNAALSANFVLQDNPTGAVIYAAAAGASYATGKWLFEDD